MDFDFIEIGTSNFRTLIESCEDSAVGISVEPIKQYLDDLPEKKNVIKDCVAITGDKVDDDKIKIYYIPDDVLVRENLPWYLRGCNKVGTYHPMHVNKKIEHLVEIMDVDVINIGDFFVKHDVRKVKFLKIDTEGHDVNIMNGLYNYIRDLSNEYHPQKITFESNKNSVETEVSDVLELFYEIGYELVQRGYDTTIRKEL